MKVYKYLYNIFYNERWHLDELRWSHIVWTYIRDSIPTVDEHFKGFMIQKLLLGVGMEYYYDERRRRFGLDACKGLHIFKHKYTWVSLSCCDAKKIQCAF